MLAVIRDRVRFHLEHGARYVQALVNHGRAAGASIEHPHAAARRRSTSSRRPWRTQLDRYRHAGADPVESEAEAAGAAGLDLLAEPVPLWCPHAGVTPFELRVAHRGTGPRFDEATDDEIAAVAIATRDGAPAPRRRRSATCPTTSSSTPRRAGTGDFHWYIEVQTRVGVVAGFEIGHRASS